MSRYSKVSRRIWRDEKFRRMTPLQPSGQALFLWLLCCPMLDCLPGLIPLGEAAIAEELGWSLEAFREAFGEAFREGLVEADWKARLVWVPNALKHNRPESPNVVRSWSSAWDLMPECELKDRAFQEFRAFTEGLGKAFAEAFTKDLPESRARARARARAEEGAREAPPSAAPSAGSVPIREVFDPDIEAIRSALEVPALADVPDLEAVAVDRLARFRTLQTTQPGFQLAWYLAAIAEAASDCAGTGLTAQAKVSTLRRYTQNARPPKRQVDVPREVEAMPMSAIDRANLAAHRADQAEKAAEMAAAKAAAGGAK